MKTKELEYFLFNHIRKTGRYISFEMEVPLKVISSYDKPFAVNLGAERVDMIAYDESDDAWMFYELKVSVSDFHSKAKLSFQGNYNYLVMPEDTFEKVKGEIPSGLGVYLARDNGTTWCYAAPKRKELGCDRALLKESFMRSLSNSVQKFYLKQHSFGAVIK